MATHLTLGPSPDHFVEAITLADGQPVGLANPLVYMNARAAGDAAYARWLHRSSAARDVNQPALLLGRYPPGTCLNGEGSFQLRLPDGRWGDQPVLPDEDIATTHRTLFDRLDQAVAVDRPCLLAARAGEWCWGHWLLDMLPRIVAAEQFSPQRFTFAIPAGIVDETTSDAAAAGYVRSVTDSLLAYGIGPSRLLRLRPHTAYRFANLFDLSGLSGKHMHPAALAAMRAMPNPPPASTGAPITALLRARPSQRAIANQHILRALLADHGCVFVNPAHASFAAQVQAIRTSQCIVGDLGSNLAAMIYARPGTPLLSLAPLGWDDDYFQKLFQRLDILHADIRGVSAPEPGQPVGQADYFINPADVRAGLHALSAASRAPERAVALVDGRLLPRRLGPVWQHLDFSTGGAAALLPRHGFTAPEPAGTWSIGPECGIDLPACPQPGPCWLEIEGTGFIHPPHLVSRPLGVSVNGERLADFDIGTETLLHVHVPAAAAGARTITFHHPICPSPKSMGASADNRALGFMFAHLRLRGPA